MGAEEQGWKQGLCPLSPSRAPQPHPGSVSSRPDVLLCGKLGSGREEAPPEVAEERMKVTSMAIAAPRRPLGEKRHSGSFRKIKSTSRLFIDF